MEKHWGVVNMTSISPEGSLVTHNFNWHGGGGAMMAEVTFKEYTFDGKTSRKVIIRLAPGMEVEYGEPFTGLPAVDEEEAV